MRLLPGARGRLPAPQTPDLRARRPAPGSSPGELSTTHCAVRSHETCVVCCSATAKSKCVLEHLLGGASLCVPSPRHCERRGPRLRSRPLAPRGQHPPGGQGLSRIQEPLFSRRALLPQTGLLRGPELELMSLSSPVMPIGFSARGPVRQLRVAELTWSRSSLTVFRKPGCVSFPS